MRVYLVILILSIVSFCFGQFAWEEPVVSFQSQGLRLGNSITTDDGVIYTFWKTNNQSEFDLYLQKVNNTGAIIWGEGIIADNKIGNQMDATIIKTSDNNYMLLWMDTSVNATGDIYIQKFNTSGQRMWQEGGVAICSHANVKSSPFVVADQNGGVYVLWTDSRNDGLSIYGANINSNGINNWTLNGILLSTDPYNFILNVYCLDDNSIIFGSESSEDINDYYRAFNLFKVTEGGEPSYFDVVDTTQTGNFHILTKLTNNTLVAWTTNSFDHTIQENNCFKCFDDNLNLLWTVYLDSYYSSITALPDSAFIYRYRSPIDGNIYAQKYSSLGVPCWAGNGVYLDHHTGGDDTYDNYLQLKAFVNNNNETYIAYVKETTDYYTQLSDYCFKMQKISSNGTAIWDAIWEMDCGEREMFCQSGNFIYYTSKKTDYPHTFVMSIINISSDPVTTNINLGASKYETVNEFFCQNNNGFNELIVKSKYGEGSYTNDEIYYYQKVSPEGYLQYPIPGQSFSGNYGRQSSMSSLVKTSDEHYVLNIFQNMVFSGDKISLCKVYNEQMSLTDSLCFDTGENEYEISAIDAFPSIDYTWLAYSYNGNMYLNRISNGQIEWELTEKNIASDCIIEDLNDRIILASEGHLSTRRLFLEKFTADGNNYPGWPDSGLTICSMPYQNNVQNCKIVPLQTGYFVIWEVLEGIVGTYSACYIDKESGEILWNNPNMLPDGVLDVKCKSDNNKVFLSYVIYGTNDRVLRLRKYEWNGSSIVCSTGFNDIDIYSSTGICSYDYAIVSGKVLYAFEDYDNDVYRIKIRAVSAQYGGLDNHPEGVCVTNLSGNHRNPIIQSSNSNSVYINWLRILPVAHTTELLTQKIDLNAFVSNTDNNAPNLSLNLKQNYPNPFNPETKISFTIPIKQKVKLEIFNIKGQKVMTIMNGELAEGTHDYVWKGVDEKGHKTASGLYFYRLVTDRETLSRKMLLIK